MSEPTKGPWKFGLIEHTPTGHTREIDGGTPLDTICTVECYEGDEANARLLAASWEMREVLQDIAEFVFEYEADGDSRWDRVVAILKKIEGK